MKIGAVFPTTEIGSDPAVIRDWTQTAEGLGYDYILTYDHVLGAEHAGREPVLSGPYTEKNPFHEPFVLFAYLAGITSTIEFCTGVVILPQRQAALVAKQAAELAVLSENRFRLGVGTGWNYGEYESLGVPFAGRGRLFDDQIEVLKALWSDSIVDYSSELHRIDRASILPLPTKPIPLWFGALSAVAVERAVREGEGLIFATRPKYVSNLLVEAQERRAAMGSEDSAFGFEASIDFSLGEEIWSEDVATWEAKGGTHVALRAMNTGNAMMGLETVDFGGPQGYIDALGTFMRAVRG